MLSSPAAIADTMTPFGPGWSAPALRRAGAPAPASVAAGQQAHIGTIARQSGVPCLGAALGAAQVWRVQPGGAVAAEAAFFLPTGCPWVNGISLGTPFQWMRAKPATFIASKK